MDKRTYSAEQDGQNNVIYIDLANYICAYFHPDIIEWITPFSKHHKQQVRINDTYLKWDESLSCVPQVSVLGPILLIIFTNQIVKAVELDQVQKYIMYAGNTTQKFSDIYHINRKVYNCNITLISV